MVLECTNLVFDGKTIFGNLHSFLPFPRYGFGLCQLNLGKVNISTEKLELADDYIEAEYKERKPKSIPYFEVKYGSKPLGQ